MTSEDSRTASPRRLRWTTWLAAGAAAVAWYLLAPLPWPARVWTTLLVVPIPFALSGQLRYVDEPDKIPRIPVYLSSTVGLWVLAMITAIVARGSGFSRTTLGIGVPPTVILIGWSVGLTAAGLGILFAARALGVRESPILRRLIPVEPAEKNAFAGLSVTAGICEELVFRGFLLYSLTLVSGSPVAALVISSAVFGWMHSYQEVGGAVRAGSIGVLLGLPAVIHASILPSIFAHAAIDLISGIVIGNRLAREMA